MEATSRDKVARGRLCLTSDDATHSVVVDDIIRKYARVDPRRRIA